MKYFRSYWRNDCRCETDIGVIIAETDEEAKEIARRHLHEEDIEISEMVFSEDGFCEVYYG